ncbi:MAG: hypothetical protein AAGA02_00210 [Bacteroidota bacterium]
MNSRSTYRHFDFSDVFSRTKKFIDEYNNEHLKLTEKLNANQRATAELIIRLYLKQLNSLSEKFDFESPNFPGFKTFNSSLATCKGCTSRTIMNHKERLKKAGFITKEEHRGAQGIEIWVNSVILISASKSAENLENQFLKIQPENTSNSVEEKNFRPLVHEPHEQRNNNSTVDRLKCVLPPKRDNQSGLDKSETTRTRHEPDKNTEENADSASNEKNNSSEADHIFLQLVMNFWAFARKILYPDLILSDPEERDIMNRIWSSVYNRFRDFSQKEWLNYHEQALERVIMVRKWLDRSPNHWIPRPDIYFSPHNQSNGFQKTLQWLLRREVLKLEVRQQLELQKIRHEQRLHSEGKGRYQHLNRLQLFRLHEQRLRRYNDPQMLEAYYVSLKNRRSP